ncbi:MAG: recombinase family protein [Melioribacteraceae bacterium]
MAKYLAYLRSSSLKQKEENTVEIQRDQIEQYARQNGLTNITYYIDEGYSGSLEVHKRPGLLELMNFLESNSDVMILFTRLDRLSRNLQHSEFLLNFFRKNKIRFYSIFEPGINGSSPSQRFFQQMSGAFSEYERTLISMRLASGRYRRAKNGKYSGGRCPIGYISSKSVKGKGKNLLKNQKSENLISEIFELRSNSNSYQSIANYLNDKAITAPNGGNWAKSTISYILNNQIYRGKYQYGEILIEKPELAFN